MQQVASQVGVAPPASEVKAAAGWERHPLDIRITIPLFVRRYYITIVAGPERRSAERLARERKKHPLLTAANVLVMLVFSTICGLGMFTLLQVLALSALEKSHFLTLP